LDPSLSPSEKISGPVLGLKTFRKKEFLSLRELTPYMFSPMNLIKPFGRLRVSQLIEFLLRTLQLSLLARDILS